VPKARPWANTCIACGNSSTGFAVVTTNAGGSSECDSQPHGGPQARAPAGRLWVMVVRAARGIAAGEEVTITYAGAHASSPLPVRRCGSELWLELVRRRVGVA